MKFGQAIEEFQKLEENKEKIVLVKCGIFMIAIGKDAIYLNKKLGLTITCFKSGVCKTGIPVSKLLEYMDGIEKIGIGYVIYDYDTETKKFEKKYSFEGNSNPETEKCLNCEECEYYKQHKQFDNINFLELMEQRKREVEK